MARKTKEADEIRQMPHDTEAEMYLLGSIFLMPEAMDEIESILSPEDFFLPTNTSIFIAMREVREMTGGTLDPALVLNNLRQTPTLSDKFSWSAEIAKIVNSVPNAAHAKYYADIIREKSRLRYLIRSATAALNACYDEDESQAIAAALEVKLASIDHAALDSPILIADAASAVMEAITATAAGGGPNRAMTGVFSLDERMGPIMEGELCIIAARPSVGKTALAQQILMHNAEGGRNVLMVSLEMSMRELATRELCKRSGVDSRLVRKNYLSHADFENMNNALTQLHGLPFWIWAPPRATMTEIRAVSRRLRASAGLSLVAIDLIGLVAPDRDQAKRKREEQIREICAAIKALGKELKIPTIALCQLGRDADGELPRLSHLRDSGRIEEDADLVLALHHNKQGPLDQRELLILKHRNGAQGQMTLSWNPQATLFGDYTPPEPVFD